MLNWTAFTEAQLLLFALIFLRMIAFVVASAFFGAGTIPTPVKILLSLILSVLMYPLVKIGNVDYLVISNEIVSLAAREIIVGLSLGFLTRIFFFVVSMVGDLIAMSVGLSAGQMFNPLLGTSGNAMESFYTSLGTLVFLAINGHHILIRAILESYTLVSVSSMSLNVGPFAEMAMFGQTAMILTIKMCAPVLVTIILVNLAMGILGRAVPQINVLVTSMPVTIMIGMTVVFICLPLMISEMHGLVEITASNLFKVMKAM
ncbi:flagellar biosynthetic protein FliR [Bdellovibrio sp. SKB1291214]|uniref:flagellar biosynthetic protein FliR n=1 Tax=Bdellovibrio sp. SKB1291214 TaxID=1732569 RepID=UPI000B51D50C|nr:flagellar biosynthetic protein FliR [Bdellovibrio sp. SKB1291214]UYL09190.1 flagellar biosynthetic protein FliR [Bdellovibrio sp. SKB1291214]